MDRSHKLDAPNNEELRTIEQIEDRSGVAAVYRNPTKQFEGDILSASEREKVQAEKVASVSGDTWKLSPKIGFLIVYPFISAALLVTILYSSILGMNRAIYIVSAIISAGFWMITSYLAYANIFKILYKHGLRAGPFLLVILASTFLGSQAISNITATYFAGQSLLTNIAFVSIATIIYSIITAYIILFVWGNVHIKAVLKLFISVIVLVVSGVAAMLTYLP